MWLQIVSYIDLIGAHNNEYERWSETHPILTSVPIHAYIETVNVLANI